MARSDANLNIPITATFDGSGFKSAESSARVFERDMARQEAAARKQAEAVERVNQSQRDAMTGAGKWILGISAASAAGLALTAKAAMDWESAWAGVTKTVDGTQAELNGLEEDLRRMARSLPSTHEEIAAVAEAAGQLGVATPDVAKFTETMLHLGNTTNLSADEAATALAQLSNIMGTSVADVSRLGSTVVALGNNSATTERSIVTMAQRMAGAATIIGLTEAETLSLAAALASVGIEVEAGGTAISRVMTDMAKAVDTGGEDLLTFAKVAGVSADEFARSFREDPADAIVTFVEGLGRIDAAGGSVFGTLEELGMSDVRVSRALLGMANSGDLLRESIDLGNRAWEENVALIEEANQRYQTTESRLQIARNQIKDAAIDIGGTFLPVVAEATEAVGAMAMGFGTLPTPVQKFVSYLGAGASGLGLLTGAAAIGIPKLHELKKTIEALHAGPSRLGSILGGTARVLTGLWGLALAAAVIGVGMWAKKQGEARQKTDELSATLDVQTGALTENSTAWLQNELTRDRNFGMRNTKSMIDAAHEMGISIETLTRAYEGQPAAIEAAKAAAQAYADANPSLTLAAASQADMFSRNLDEQAQRLEEAKRITLAKKAVDAAATEQTGALADATAGLNAELDDTATEASAAKEAVNALKQALRDLNSPMLDLSDAQIAWQQTLSEINAQLEEHGQNLDIATEAGRANQSFLNDMARDAMALADALLMETGSEAEFRVSLEQSRVALAETAEQLGMSAEEAWAFADAVLQIPPSAVVEVDAETGDALVALNQFLVEVDGADGTVTINGKQVNAQQTLGELIGNIDESDGTVTINGEKVPAEVTLQQLLDLIDGSRGVASIMGDDKEGRERLRAFVAAIGASSASVTVNASMANAYADLNRFIQDSRGRTVTVYSQIRTVGQAAQADGSVLDFYASGGVRESHVAQIAPAGAWRVWAEPETGGEAYIPLSPSKRARSEEILGTVADRFGMYVGHYASGGIVGGGASTGSPVAASRDLERLATANVDLLAEMRHMSSIIETLPASFETGSNRVAANWIGA